MMKNNMEVALPCKVGDTIWESNEHLPVCLVECVVKRFEFNAEGKVFCVYSNGSFDSIAPLDIFGERLFLTEEDAKKRLAEMKGEE